MILNQLHANLDFFKTFFKFFFESFNFFYIWMYICETTAVVLPNSKLLLKRCMDESRPVMVLHFKFLL